MTQFQMMTPKPDGLPDWPNGIPEPVYDYYYLIRLYNCDPHNLQVEISKRKDGPASQADLDDAYIKSSTGWQLMTPSSTGTPLDLSLRGRNALIIFSLVNPKLAFITDQSLEPSLAVVKMSGARDNLFNVRWKKDRDYQVVSVILSGKAEAMIYGLGIVVDDGQGHSTPMFIDPKIDNTGTDP